jgi:1-deoxy-D-xylulose-5-phosphate synthase
MLKIGKAEILSAQQIGGSASGGKKGETCGEPAVAGRTKGVVIAIGSMVYPALEATQGLDIEVINARFVKPIDETLLIKLSRQESGSASGGKNLKIITVEENTLTGGFGSAVLEFFNNKNIPVSILRLGLPDEFIEHGSRKILLDKYGLTAEKIKKEIEKFIAL